MQRGAEAMEVTIRPLTSDDAAAFRALRIEALRRHPQAFGASAEEAEALDVAGFAAGMPKQAPDAIFGAFLDAELVGMAGFFAHRAAKTRHKGVVWGLYVRDAVRGRGIAGRLMRAAIAAARAAGLDRLLLTVTTGNASAQALYDRLGFTPYGIERAALRLPDGGQVDEELRVLDLRA